MIGKERELWNQLANISWMPFTLLACLILTSCGNNRDRYVFPLPPSLPLRATAAAFAMDEAWRDSLTSSSQPTIETGDKVRFNWDEAFAFPRSLSFENLDTSEISLLTFGRGVGQTLFLNWRNPPCIPAPIEFAVSTPARGKGKGKNRTLFFKPTGKAILGEFLGAVGHPEGNIIDDPPLDMAISNGKLVISFGLIDDFMFSGSVRVLSIGGDGSLSFDRDLHLIAQGFMKESAGLWSEQGFFLKKAGERSGGHIIFDPTPRKGMLKSIDTWKRPKAGHIAFSQAAQGQACTKSKIWVAQGRDIQTYGLDYYAKKIDFKAAQTLDIDPFLADLAYDKGRLWALLADGSLVSLRPNSKGDLSVVSRAAPPEMARYRSQGRPRAILTVGDGWAFAWLGKAYAPINNHEQFAGRIYRYRIGKEGRATYDGECQAPVWGLDKARWMGDAVELNLVSMDGRREKEIWNTDEEGILERSSFRALEGFELRHVHQGRAYLTKNEASQLYSIPLSGGYPNQLAVVDIELAASPEGSSQTTWIDFYRGTGLALKVRGKERSLLAFDLANARLIGRFSLRVADDPTGALYANGIIALADGRAIDLGNGRIWTPQSMKEMSAEILGFHEGTEPIQEWMLKRLLGHSDEGVIALMQGRNRSSGIDSWPALAFARVGKSGYVFLAAALSDRGISYGEAVWAGQAGEQIAYIRDDQHIGSIDPQGRRILAGLWRNRQAGVVGNTLAVMPGQNEHWLFLCYGKENP